MRIDRAYINSTLYDEKRNVSDIEFIVIQDIGNKHSAHYIVLDGKAIQKIPDEYTSLVVNGGKLNKCGYLHGICTKYNSLSISVPGKMSSEDLDVCIKVIMTLKQRYNISNDNIIRQMDVTGACNPEEWQNKDRWETDIKDKLIEI